MIDVSVSGHYVGDCRELLAQLPERCAQTCVTSPPYYGLRDYGHDGQIGLEKTPDEYIAALVEVFRGVRRALRDDGTLWVNIGDSYCSIAGGYDQTGSRGATASIGAKTQSAVVKGRNRRPPDGLKPKDLVGIPWMVALALRSAGWYLRQDIIWHKPNPMPESVRDRCTKAHEYIFLLSKSERYYFDREGTVERSVFGNGNSHFNRGKTLTNQGGPSRTSHRPRVDRGTRNKRSVWTVATQPYSGAHFAVFPPRLIEPCILAGSKPSDLVLDPFFGSGTTGLVAQQHGRRYIGFDLGYHELATERLRAPMLPMRGVS